MNEKLQELIKYIEENHSWKNMYDITVEQRIEGRIFIKYFQLYFDTRDMACWNIKFYNIQNANMDEDEIEFVLETDEDYEKVYKWLRGEVNA